jgi:hypothetical protein
MFVRGGGRPELCFWGGFSLKFAGEVENKEKYQAFGISATLLAISFFLQLLLIPHALWGSHVFIQFRCFMGIQLLSIIFGSREDPKVLGDFFMKKYELGTRLALALKTPNPAIIFDQSLLDSTIWRVWKDRRQMAEGKGVSFNQNDLDGIANDDECKLLETLFREAT